MDLLPTTDHLRAWLRQAGLLDEERVAVAFEGRDPGELQRILAEGRTLRAVFREMLAQLVAGHPVGEAPLEAINRLLQAGSGSLALIRDGAGFRKRFVQRPEVLIHLLVPLAEVAVDLLAEGDLALIKHCGNPECVRYFYDTTRNHSRRWCSMEGCGNRRKAAAYYRRQRQRLAGDHEQGSSEQRR